MNTSSQLNKIYPVACHTDNVGPDSTFVAIKGMSFDGADYISVAIAKGATKIVVQHGTDVGEISIPVEYVEDTRLALAQLSAQALDFPAKKLKIIGITGTKGKSTTTFLLEHILRTSGIKTAMLSTVVNRIDGINYKAPLTTAQPDYLHMFFDRCVKENIEWVVMEVAAQAFSLNRVHGLEFDIGAFTNFSQEHGEFYDSMADYFSAKKELIKQLKLNAPFLINRDDRKVFDLINFVENPVVFDGINSYVCPALIGEFNSYNVTVATRCAEFAGIGSQAIQKSLNSFVGVPGRMEKYTLSNGATGIIDYAHNAASYKAVLSELRKHTDHLIVIFGCAGDRDKSRRPAMGRIASEYADVMVLSSDNPRSENPQVIADEVLSGIDCNLRQQVIVELDREKAIQKAYAASCNGSIIAILGKGPDEYQIIGNITYTFSEKAILKQL